MDTLLNASASTAGSLISSSVFEVPPYQREYSWREDEVREFFEDIRRSLESDSYFLGLIILTEENGRKKIVDGQQRVVTLTLLASALHFEALKRDRNALADRLKADFLTCINYETDSSDPRVYLTDEKDNKTLQDIISKGYAENIECGEDSVSAEILKSYEFIQKSLKKELAPDPFKRLGKWTDFITNKLYFAVFVHPDPSSAYQVFEVINTRGRDLTTADLLKNYVISQAGGAERDNIYKKWQELSENFSNEGTNNFVQYIRHVVTVNSGYVLPKDLFSFLASRNKHSSRLPPTSYELIILLEKYLPIYRQMIDPSSSGPASEVAIGVFQALSRLNVMTVRPLMLAIIDSNEDSDAGLLEVLKLVVRRIVTGNLGTGNIERRFSEAARKVRDSGTWNDALNELSDLNPSRSTFIDKITSRSLNKAVMTYLRNSIIQNNLIPSTYYYLHYLIPKSLKPIPSISEGELAYWGTTIGNTILITSEKRPTNSDDWKKIKSSMIDSAPEEELTRELLDYDEWTVESIESMAKILSTIAAGIWYA